SVDLLDDALELGARSDEGIDVLDRRDTFILRGRRARDGDQRFAGGVRDEVEMEEVATQGKSSGMAAARRLMPRRRARPPAPGDRESRNVDKPPSERPLRRALWRVSPARSTGPRLWDDSSDPIAALGTGHERG